MNNIRMKRFSSKISQKDLQERLNLSKVFTIGPITGLLYCNSNNSNSNSNSNSNNNNNGIVFVGIGGILQVISNLFHKNYKTTSIIISEIDTIAGIKYIDKKIYDENNILVYGGKAINIITFHQLNEIDIDISIKYKFHQLDDLVLDVTIIKEISKIYLFIGYAHNFIDIIELDHLNNNIINKRRIHCIDVCCLFSLAFNISDMNNILIASGNVFGKITIWKINNNDNTHTTINTLIGHEGVIFNIKWNNDKIATVSDDRSIRIWDSISGNPIFIGWGHVCRPWDSLFINNIDNKELIATSSEEGTIKIWDINEKKCICNLRGHSSDIWRLTYIDKLNLIISGGNDGSIHFWNLESHLLSCPDNIESTSLKLTIPVPKQDKVCLDGNNSRRNNGICFLRISKDGKFILIGFIEGRICIFMNDFCENSNENSNWIDIITLDDQITCGDVYFKSSNHFYISCGHMNGSLSLIKVYFDTSSLNQNWNCNVSNYEGHPLRIINIWFLYSSIHSDYDNLYLFSASVKGHNKIWNMNVFDDNNSNISILSIKEVFTVTKQVATCSVLIFGTEKLIIGDSRGNISIFFNDNSMNLLQHISKAHGNDQLPISNLTICNNGFYSLGHDGFLNRYEEEMFFNDDDSIGIKYKLSSKLSCLPLKTPDQLIVFNDDDDNNNTSIYIAGFLGNIFIVWDIQNKHQLMRVEGGSWKRAHHCIISFLKPYDDMIIFPRVIFSCPIPNNQDTNLIINDSIPNSMKYSKNIFVFSPIMKSSLSLSLHSGYPSLGKVGYCTIILTFSNLKYLLIAGEEGIIKVFSIIDNEKFIYCEDLIMPYNVSIRALEKLYYDNDNCLIIAGGGRLMYSIWKYSKNNHFSLLCTGTILPNASQDHRILSISSYSIIIGDVKNYYFTFGDSRGIVTKCKLDTVLKVINEVKLSSNGYPILSSKVMTSSSLYNDDSLKFAIGSYGDTNGNISILILHYNYFQKENIIFENIYTYSAHTMGTNTLDVVLYRLNNNNNDSSFEFKIISGGDDQSLTLCYGTISFINPNVEFFEMNFTINSIKVLENACGSALKGVKFLKLLDFFENSNIIISIGYDRRLSTWLLNQHDDDDNDKVVFCKNYNSLIFRNEFFNGNDFIEDNDDDDDKILKSVLDLSWVMGSIVDIGDICSIDALSYDYNLQSLIDIAIIGEGVQYFILEYQ